MASVIPKEVKKEIVDGWVAETTHKVALLTTAYTWVTGHDLYTDVSGSELPAGSGYTTGGATLAGRSSNASGQNYYLDATDTSWTSATFTNVRYVVEYETTGNKIRAIFDLGAGYSIVAGTFTLQWNASGLITVS